ncbi:MAG: efflux RND transporter periplasmic adaptor subunit [Kiritimatiellia bacterium]
MRRRGVAAGAMLALLLAGCGEKGPGGAIGGVGYRTAPIARTDIVCSVSATGTVTPRNTANGIPVGAQVNGKIIRLYVDYNDTVTNNQAVAEIDPLVYEADYKSAVARLHVNERGVDEARCTLKVRQEELLLAEKTYNRKKTLAEKLLAPVADYDSAREAFVKAKLGVESAEAALRSAEANVEASRASCDQAKANLDYCTIRSPVNGVIIDRKVELGETVVSSMNAVPVLTIAEDLDIIWISADVPEADIGSIRLGQRVIFTVDAYKTAGRLRTFTGKVKQIRKASTTTNNVVTFPVIVEAENPGQLLFPGMTATLTIETARAENVLAVSAAAFRFRPKDDDPARPDDEIPEGAHLWLAPRKPGEPLECIRVEAGVTDDAFTELLAGDPAELEGRMAVLGYATARMGAADASDVKNPFMPKFPKHNKNKGTAPKKQ